MTPQQSNYSDDTLLDKISAITGIAATSDQTARLASLFISEQIKLLESERSTLLTSIEAEIDEDKE